MDSKLFITLPHDGMVDWQTTYSSADGVLESVESDVSMDGPLTVRLWESSKDALPPFTELKHKWGAANTERFDSTGEGKIAVLNVYFHEPARNPLDTYSISPHDTWIRASSNEEIHLLQYDSSSNQVMLNPSPTIWKETYLLLKHLNLISYEDGRRPTYLVVASRLRKLYYKWRS